jgi:hypothetical protein
MSMRLHFGLATLPRSYLFRKDSRFAQAHAMQVVNLSPIIFISIQWLCCLPDWERCNG